MNADEGELAATARLAVETGIRLARLARRAVRASPPDTIPLSRLRALAYLHDNPGVCVSDLADHLWVGVPTASKLADGLVEQGLVVRETDASDRRRVALRSTAEGARCMATAARPAQARMARVLSHLEADERTRVREGLEVLLPLLRRAGGSEGDRG